MSFSFNFRASDAAAARTAIDGHASAPEAIRAFIHAAVDNTPWAADKDINVQANGHLCQGNGSDTTSSVTIVVSQVERQAPVADTAKNDG